MEPFSFTSQKRNVIQGVINERVMQLTDEHVRTCYFPIWTTPHLKTSTQISWSTQASIKHLRPAITGLATYESFPWASAIFWQFNRNHYPEFRLPNLRIFREFYIASPCGCRVSRWYNHPALLNWSYSGCTPKSTMQRLRGWRSRTSSYVKRYGSPRIDTKQHRLFLEARDHSARYTYCGRYLG